MTRSQQLLLAAALAVTAAAASLLLLQSLGEEASARGQEALIRTLETENRSLRSRAYAHSPRSAPEPALLTTGDLVKAERNHETRAGRSPVPADQPDPLRTRLASGLIPIAEVHDRGIASPRAALETSLWAIHEARVDRLVEGLDLTAAGSEAAQELFNGLPPQAQAEYHNPAYLLATLIVYGYPVAGYQIGAAGAHPDDPSQWSIQTTVQLEDGRTVQPAMQLRDINGVWRIEADQQLVRQFASFLKSAARGP